jgi:hypothetical protein
LAPHVGQAIADVLIGPPHCLQVVIAISGILDGEFDRTRRCDIPLKKFR